VHPQDEQQQIKLMEAFCWNLLSSQDVKTVDNSLERRGDDLYQVRTTEHYVKLTFSRDLDTPHLAEIRKLEAEYENLRFSQPPSMFPGCLVGWLFSFLIYGVGFVVWLIYFFTMYKPQKAAVESKNAEVRARREAILREVAAFH
jgi:hypothetical protein